MHDRDARSLQALPLARLTRRRTAPFFHTVAASIGNLIMKGQWVEIEFDCLPLRSISRLDVPVDASPKYEQKILRIKAAMEKHGCHNTYYLHAGKCRFHLTNDAQRGSVEMQFEGTLLTDEHDRRTRQMDVVITLGKETCSWLNERIVEFFVESTRHALRVEFDRYIEAGDLQRTEARLTEIQEQSEQSGGFIGMHL